MYKSFVKMALDTALIWLLTAPLVALGADSSLFMICALRPVIWIARVLYTATSVYE